MWELDIILNWSALKVKFSNFALTYDIKTLLLKFIVKTSRDLLNDEIFSHATDNFILDAQ